MLHLNWRACSASSVPHRSSCWRPISPSWAPVSHITSPGSSATNVQLAPKKNGLRPVGPARATNLFEPSSGLSARRSYLWSLRCPRFPLWALASPMADLATPCTPGAQCSCAILERFISGPCSRPPAPRRGPKKPRAFFAALSSSRTARYPGCRYAGRACKSTCGNSFSCTIVSWPSSVMQKIPGMAVAPSRGIVVSPSSQKSTSSCKAPRTSSQCG